MEKKRLFELSPEERWKRLQENPKRVLMKGKEKNLLEMIDWYYGHINDGFELMVDDLAEFLDCSYDYVLRNIAPNLLHIRITDTIRPHLLKGEHAEDYHPLLYKRILFEKDSWRDYLLQQGTYDLKYKRIVLTETKEFRDWIHHHQLSTTDSRVIVNQAFRNMVEERGIRVEPNEIERIPLQEAQIQTKWHSMKSIMRLYGFRYPVQVYRFLESRGVNPIRLGNFVRYNIVELEAEDVVFCPYFLFQETQSQLGEILMSEWLKKANEVKEKIVAF